MKRNVGTQFFYLIVVACLFSAGNARGTEIQINVWTNSVSGYWEEPFWSAGAIPGTNQSILFTNAWQALAIGSSTVSSHPESLQVEAVTLAAPANSFDELLLNYAGFDTALVIGRDASAGTNAFLGSLVVKTNSAVVILSSALQVNNYRTNWTERGAFSIGGEFNQGDFAKVTAGFLHVGDIGPGTYNLTNGLVSVSNEYIGGSFGGVFNQFGGYNEAAVEVSAGGEYDLYGGDFGGSVTFRPVGYSSGTFRQFGGTFTGDVSYMIGNYLLEGGVFTSSSLEIPGEFGNPGPNMTGKFLQTGGTNFCQSITLWGDSPREATSHTGTYTLTNGSLFVSGPLWLHGYGYYSQSGGVQTNSGVSVGADGGYSVAAVAGFSLSGGAMMTPGLFVIGGDYGQSGGTNLIFGDLSFSGRTVSIVFPTGYRDVGSFSLSGGTISCSNATVVTDPAGALSQSGGVLQVVNLLAVSGRSWADMEDII